MVPVMAMARAAGAGLSGPPNPKETLMSTFNDVAQRYIDAWNETDSDAAVRRWMPCAARTPAT
jgi:hypothetical protein